MDFEYIGILLLFMCSDLPKPGIATSESNNHTYGNYCKVEIYFTVEILPQKENMNQRKNHAMYKHGLRTD